jgi:L-seryl-tRNA(Ser) seleniumtransferase
VRCSQQSIEEARRDILAGKITEFDRVSQTDLLGARAAFLANAALRPKIMRAVNGAGVILHTGLGRAPLPKSAQEALIEAAKRYSLLALDRSSGKRGDRHLHCDGLLRELTGAEASLVVNNNAAAVLLALTAFSTGREAIISRGELVEIGGSFRIPDVMARSGARMIEVGATNKTHLHDYETAVTAETAVLLKVHTSNYRIEGFHKEVSVAELSLLSRARSLILLHDIGSGALIDLRRWGLPYEPTVPEAISDGADIVTFSGDKLVGGPQCGIIVGRRELIERLKKHPLVRALRPDKLTLAALEGTLRLFLDPERLPETHPVYKMLTASLSQVERRARRILQRLRPLSEERFTLEIRNGSSEVGSGALPARSIPTKVVAIIPRNLTAEQLAQRLRLAAPPLFSRIENDCVILDARTIADEEVRIIPGIMQQALRTR